MAPRQQVWTFVYLDCTPDDEGDDRGVLKHEVVRDRATLEAKIIAHGPAGFLAFSVEPLNVTVDTSPRITFDAPAKKPRAPRSDKGKPRAKKGEVTS